MAFPSTPTNKQIHIENGITFRFLAGLNRWELWNDSDATEANLDSEYHARREADSDIIYGRYHNFAVDKVESLINASGPITINYNTGADTYTVTPGTSGWVWVPSASKLFIIQFGNISELKLIGSEPTEFTRIYTVFRKADTTGVSVDYQENGVTQQTVNASNYIFIAPTFQGTYPNIRGSIDSELNLREHLSQTAESLKLMSLLYNHNDSEMYKKLDNTNLDLDSEIHDRKAADSDLSVRDSELDSDIKMEIHDRMAADSDQENGIVRGVRTNGPIRLFDPNTAAATRFRGPSGANDNTLPVLPIINASVGSFMEYQIGGVYVPWEMYLVANQNGNSTYWTIVISDENGIIQYYNNNTYLVSEGLAAIPFYLKGSNGLSYERGALDHQIGSYSFYDYTEHTLIWELKDSEYTSFREMDALLDRTVEALYLRDEAANQDIAKIHDLLDSEYRQRKDEDSDIYYYLEDNMDSEEHGRKAGDSDLRKDLDSEIHDRKAADSDFNDVYSLQISRQKIDIPSVADFVRVDTAWNFLNTANNTSGWYTHNDGFGTQRTYIVINGRLITQYVGTAAEVTVNNRTYRRELVHFAQRILERDGVGQSIQALVYNFHVERLDKLDFEMVIDSETTRAGLDSDIKNNFVEIIKSFRLLDSEVGILQNFDSDLTLRLNDLDSENKRMHDSDRHDWKADDSDIRNRKATSAYMMEDTVFIPKTQLTGGSVQFLTDGTVIDQVNIRSEFGSAWFTFASSIFTGLLNDTNVIVVDDEVVGVFADPGFATTEYTVGNKTYRRLAQTGIVVQISGPGNPATNSNPYGVGVNYDDQLEYTNRKELKTPEDFDSDTTRNFDLIAVALSRLDSEIKFVADDLVKNYVAYDSDSEIEAAALRLTGDENVGRIFWDDNDKTVAATLNSDVTLQIGQEFHFFGKADSDISNGDLVMFAGAQGDHFLMRKADHRRPGFIPEHIMGVATSDITQNQFGYVTQVGKVRGLNTSAFTEGSLLYSDPFVDGRLLDSEPTYPSHSILVAAVTRSHATEGSIYVRITHKRDLDELHGVLITDPPEGTKHNQVVAWDSDSTLWRNISINTDFGDF